MKEMPHRRFSSKVLGATAREYAAASSAHGVGYILEPGRWGVERALWVLTVVVMAAIRYLDRQCNA